MPHGPRRRRRAKAAEPGRQAGIDVNVSRVAVVSVDRHPSEVGPSTISIDPQGRVRIGAERLRTRRRARASERSRRSGNTAQHRWSRARHCRVGTRVPKTLADRAHRCPRRGLAGDRDLVAAAPAAFATFRHPLDPGHGPGHPPSRQARPGAAPRAASGPGRVKCHSAATSPPTPQLEGTGQPQKAPGLRRRPSRMSSRRRSPEGTTPGQRWCLPDLPVVLPKGRTHDWVLRSAPADTSPGGREPAPGWPGRHPPGPGADPSPGGPPPGRASRCARRRR